jgi:hypothetical protein
VTPITPVTGCDLLARNLLGKWYRAGGARSYCRGEEEMNALKGLLRMRAEPDTGLSAVEVLGRTPLIG